VARLNSIPTGCPADDCLVLVSTEWIARRMFIFYRDKGHRNLVASHGIYRRARVGVQLQSTSLCKSK
jgi:hypothetical protein